MICRGLVLTRLRAGARGRRMEEVSRLEHELLEASSSLKQVVDANTTYEKKLCDQAAEWELDAARIVRLECLEADRAAENDRLKKALEEAGQRMLSLEGDVDSLKRGKESVEAELDKTLDDTMALISQSFNLSIQKAWVLYGGPPPSGEFDQEMEVFDDRLVPANKVQRLQTAVGPAPSDDAEDRSLGF